MKLTAVLCLCLLLVHNDLSLAAKKGKGGLLSIFKKPSKSKTDLNAKSKDSSWKKEKPQYNQGNYPQQPAGGYPQYPSRPGGYPNQGGYPQQPAGGYPQYPGRPGGYPNQGGYPQQPAGGYPQYPGRPGGYPNQGGYPQQPAGGYPQYPGRPGGYPNQGGYPQYPAYPGGGYPAGGYPSQVHTYGGGYGTYPGSYINYNPNNKILSPHYGSSFGYGGYGGGGGSPFSHSVQAMGYAPSYQSKGFGRSAAMAAAGGAVAGMALGYGLGRFPRPNFHFHSPQEEYFYNYYMYRKYGMKSTDKNDYSRDYKYNQQPETFERYMESCMKRTDLLPGENRKLDNKQTVTPTITTTTASVNTTTTGISIYTKNSTEARNVSTTSPSVSQPQNKSEVDATTPKASQTLKKDDSNDDTVSIVEIGYPALIKQMKVKRCTELFIVYSEKHLKKKTQHEVNSGVQGLEMGFLSVLSTATLMLMLQN